MEEYQDNREIRIFISSTFSDMQGEREYLIKKVFPRLQAEAKKNDVAVVPIDLRWGITEEDAKNGKVVEICLDEIQNSRPFFIGLIGHRYGTCTTKEELFKNQNLKDKYGSFLEAIDGKLSITELEMQYGVLKHKNPIDAFFYFKTGDDAPEDTDYLSRLRNAIQKDGRYPIASYSSPEDLGEQIETAFLQLLNERFPKQEQSYLATIRRRHETLMYYLADGYIEDPSNISNLNEWIEDPKEQFIVLRGDVGIGKSALIAYWLREQYKMRPDKKVIWHCVAYASDKKDDGEAVRKRLTAEIADLYQLPDDTKLEALLEMIQDKDDLLIIIDGLEKFTTNDGSKQLLWMPRMPKNVKVMLTTTPDDESMESLSYRHWLCLTLPPLSIKIRSEIIQKYLIKYGKKLTEAQVDKIANTKLFENTSALMSLLNELVSFGDYYQLDQHLDNYLHAQSLAELYELILSRCEQDYGEQLVKDVLSFFWVSRKGLSESEIMQAANLIQLSWSQFYCAFSTHFNRRDGLLYISNPILKEAVYQRYLSNKSENQYRRRLTKIFKEHVAGHDCSELCYQYFLLQDDDALYREILDFNVYYYTASNSEQEPNSIWSRLLASDLDKYKFEAYLEIWPTNPTQTEISAMAMIADLVWKRFENFKLSTKMLALALEAQRALSGEISQETCDIEMEVANMLYDVRKLDSAWKIYQQVLEKRKKIYGDIHPKIAFTYEMMGHVLNCKEDYDAAEDTYNKALKILLAIYNRPHYKTANIIHNLASIQQYKGNYEEAAKLYNQAITMWHQTLGNLSSELVCGYKMLAFNYIDAEKWDDAWEALVSCFIRCERIYGTRHYEFTGIADSLERVWHILEEKGIATDKQRKDYEIYLSGMVIKAHIKEDGSAFQKGLRGTYDVLKYANWDITKPQPFFDEQKLMAGKEKYITFYKEGQIISEHFDGQLGIIFERMFDANLHEELAKVYNNKH